jgi:hypothetical protein
MFVIADQTLMLGLSHALKSRLLKGAIDETTDNKKARLGKDRLFRHQQQAGFNSTPSAIKKQFDSFL